MSEYERLKNNILSLNLRDKLKTIMVAGSVRKEGCSTVALNLAKTLTHKTSKVLLIDADFRHPVLHRYLGLKNGTGLSDVVLGDAKVEDAILKTQLSNLFLITTGIFEENPTKILASPTLDKLILQWQDEFDYVVVDSAPVNAFPDASILAGKTDGVVLVIRAGRTRWEAAQYAKQQLEMNHAKIIGAVLSRRKYVIPRFIYNRLR